MQGWEMFLEYREEYPRNGTGNIGGVGGCKPRHVAVSGPGFLSPIGGGDVGDFLFKLQNSGYRLQLYLQIV